MKDPVYQFTETEAKAYDAMRSVMDRVFLGVYSECAFAGSRFCSENDECETCDFNKVTELLAKVNDEQDNEK